MRARRNLVQLGVFRPWRSCRSGDARGPRQLNAPPLREFARPERAIPSAIKESYEARSARPAVGPAQSPRWSLGIVRCALLAPIWAGGELRDAKWLAYVWPAYAACGGVHRPDGSAPAH